MPLTPIAELQSIIQSHIARRPLALASENIALAQAAGRVLAQDIVAPVSIPSSHVSAMDGYALAQATPAHSRLTIVGESAAGSPFTGSLKAGECIRIMTGATVPACCSTVVIQENVIREGDCIVLQQDAPAAANIRYAGEEIQAGQTVLSAGRILRHADVMLLAAQGIGSVAVQRKLRVAILSTGNELAEAGSPIATHQIYDSNRPMLHSKLRDCPADIIDLGKLPDNLDATVQKLHQAAEQSDVVMTSGGVSVGDYDYLRQAVAQVGTIHHYKVAMKPGKPFVFGQLGSAWYFGLPGNPVSGYVGFDLFIRSALWQIAGATPIPQPLRFQAALTCNVKKAAGRADIQRAIISQNSDGTWQATPAGKQDSHRILGVSQANAYMILPQECGDLAAGEMVTVQPLHEAFL